MKLYLSKNFVLIQSAYRFFVLFSVCLTQNWALNKVRWSIGSVFVGISRLITLDLTSAGTPVWLTCYCVMSWRWERFCKVNTERFQERCLSSGSYRVVILTWSLLKLDRRKRVLTGQAEPSQNIYRNLNTFLLIESLTNCVLWEFLHLRNLLF